MGGCPLSLGSRSVPVRTDPTQHHLPLLYVYFRALPPPSRRPAHHRGQPGCCPSRSVLEEAVPDLPLLGGDPFARGEGLVGPQVLRGHALQMPPGLPAERGAARGARQQVTSWALNFWALGVGGKVARRS